MKLFLTSNASMVMDKIVSKLGKEPADLRVAFVPTAGDVYEQTPWIEDDRNKLLELGFKVVDVDIKDKTEHELEPVLSDSDIIFVAGGNTFYLQEMAVASAFDVLVRKLVGTGKTYIGSSAGSVIAGPDIEAVAVFDDPEAGKLASTKSFGLVDFVVLPHFGKEKYGPYHGKVIQEFGDKYKIIPITDEQYIESDGTGYKII